VLHGSDATVRPILFHPFSTKDSCHEKVETKIAKRSGANQSHKEDIGTCIATSLTVRDFLRSLGFSADVKSVVLSQTLTDQGGINTRELLVGGRALVGPDAIPSSGKIGWDGHLVCIMPKERLLIDATFYQMRRDWCSWIPGVVIVPLLGGAWLNGLEVLGGYERHGGYRSLWAANPSNTKWCSAPAAGDSYRAPFVKEMRRKFKEEFKRAA
jgi:hypothetical protein